MIYGDEFTTSAIAEDFKFLGAVTIRMKPVAQSWIIPSSGNGEPESATTQLPWGGIDGWACLGCCHATLSRVAVRETGTEPLGV